MRRRATLPIVTWVLMVLALVVATEGTALACPVCFQVEDGPVTDGLRAAVLVLVGVTTCVLAGFAAFIVRFWRTTQARPVPETGRSVEKGHVPLEHTRS